MSCLICGGESFDELPVKRTVAHAGSFFGTKKIVCHYELCTEHMMEALEVLALRKAVTTCYTQQQKRRELLDYLPEMTGEFMKGAS